MSSKDHLSALSLTVCLDLVEGNEVPVIDSLIWLSSLACAQKGPNLAVTTCCIMAHILCLFGNVYYSEYNTRLLIVVLRTTPSIVQLSIGGASVLYFANSA